VQYCPRVDFSIGPFNRKGTPVEIRQSNRQISNKLQMHSNLIDELRDIDQETEYQLINEEGLRDEWSEFGFEYNRNPRCFLVIEKENLTGPKHILGSMFNASVLGKVGIVIAANDDKYRELVKMRRFIRFTLIVGKMGGLAEDGEPPNLTLGKNLIILPKVLFLRVLESHPPFNNV